MEIESSANHKIGVYTERGNTYMTLDLDTILDDGRKMHLTIPKIDLNSLSINLNEGIYNTANISFDLKEVKDSYMTITDITKYKEMSLNDIEKELGYKIKLTNK